MEQSQEQMTDLIIRCLIGEAKEGDMERLQSWTSSSEDNMRYFRQLQDIWTSSATSESLSRFDVSEAFNRFRDRVNAVGGFKKSTDELIAPHRSWFYMPVWARWAAAIVIFIGSFWWVYQHGQKGVERQFADITIEAPTGSQTIMTLPDGTKVTLNAHSRITYSQGFGISDREVTISGEGFFEVKHDSELPFSVTTGNVKVNDIGTKFNVCDYPDDDEAEVVLTEGAVSLDNLLKNEETVTLKPGDRAVLSKRTGHITVRANGGITDAVWTSGILVMDGKSIQTIASEMGHVYGVKVTIASNRLSACRFYGRFDTHQMSLREVLDALVATGKLHYSISGKNVTLY